MPEWLKKLFEKMDVPQRIYQSVYDALQLELMDIRQQCCQSIAAEKQLEQRLKDKQNSPEDTAQLETELIKQQTTTRALRLRLETLELEVQKTYTKKQVGIARQKAMDAWQGPDPTRATLVIIAIMTVWALVGVFINLKSHY